MVYVLVFRRYAPFATFGGGFEGDRRSGASTSLTATSRTMGMVMFDRGSVGTISGSSSGTSYLGFGPWVADFLGRHYSKVKADVARVAVSPTGIAFMASTEGPNPMIPGAPDIDTYIDFSARWVGSAVGFKGSVRGDDFPNLEIFVLDGAGKVALVFNGVTSRGRNTGPFAGLPGSGVGNTVGRFSVMVPLDASGAFAASVTSCPPTTM